MALVIRKHKVIFLHYPKTGGTSFNRVMQSMVHPYDKKRFYIKNDHANAEFLAREIPRTFFESKKVTTVRNPFAILPSLYYYKKGQPKTSTQRHIALCRKLSLEEFIEHFCETVFQDNPQSGHFAVIKKGQLAFHSVAGECALNAWEKLESLTPQKARDLMGIKSMKDLPKVNTFGNVTDYRKYYNTERREMVENLFRSDLEFFDYEF